MPDGQLRKRHILRAERLRQKLAIGLVGSLPEIKKGNRWVLVLTDQLTSLQDAFAIPDTTASVVASPLDERVFFYLELPEEIHADQGGSVEVNPDDRTF